MVVGHKGDLLHAMMSSNGTCDHKVLEGQALELPLRTPQVLDMIVDDLGHGIWCIGIVMSHMVFVLVIDLLEVLKPFCFGMVGIGSKGDESGRRRSVGIRHFMWRMG